MNAFSQALAKVIADNPGITIDVKEGTCVVGFWFETAVGRDYVCACKTSFDDAFTAAMQRRIEKTASALIEAEVRREVEARMAA